MEHHKSAFDRLEETLIAGILGAMVLITFANVIARFGFNSNILWALELTVFLFAWLVLLGASYAVKIHAHLGVDAIINMVDRRGRRAMGLFSIFCCILFAIFLLKGSWDYWANFANLPATEGRWFPTGFQDKFRGKGWYEVESVVMPDILRFMEGIFNEGDAYEKIPRLIPYAVLPFSMALLLFRFIQAGVHVWRGDIDNIIATHEVEDELDEIRQKEEV